MYTQSPRKLSDKDLLSMFLSKRKGIKASQRAVQLLDKYKDIPSMIGTRPYSEGDITKSEERLINASLELARRVAYDQILRHHDVLSTPEHVRHFLTLHHARLEHETFCAIFLDNRHRVIAFEELFTGTIDSAAVYPREIVKRCLSTNSAAVIFSHGHPSGVAEPSDTDVRLTRKLVDALALIDVRVLDHIVFGQGIYTSLAERGLM